MFEKAKPLVRLLEQESQADSHARQVDDYDPSAAHHDAPAGGGDALRAIEWSELTARLDAARDLRVLLRQDARLNIEDAAASFGDAAARYFAALNDGERPVNSDGLEARKASHGILRSQDGDAATGDARED